MQLTSEYGMNRTGEVFEYTHEIEPGFNVKCYVQGDKVLVRGRDTIIPPKVRVIPRPVEESPLRVVEETKTYRNSYSRWDVLKGHTTEQSKYVQVRLKEAPSESYPSSLYVYREFGVMSVSLLEHGLISITVYKNGNKVGSTEFSIRDETFTIDSSSGYRNTIIRSIPNLLMRDSNVIWKTPKEQIWMKYFEMEADPDMTGLKNVFKKHKDKIDKLQKDNPEVLHLLLWLSDSTVREGTTNNKIICRAIETASPEEIAASAKKMLEVLTCESDHTLWREFDNPLFVDPYYCRIHETYSRSMCMQLPGAEEKKIEELAKKDWTLRKTNEAKAEGLGINDYPLLLKEVVEGGIPFSVFHNPDKTPVNLEFSIWEKALAREGWAPIISKIALDAGRHTTYGKDITPYLAFLFQLEVYLEKHTGQSWSALPKYVESQWELEMDEANENGTVKRRSAFTPIADNENWVVEVPYVAVSVGGARTQWCYSRHYHLAEAGRLDPEGGGIWTSDLRKKLNGRDDYGMMYYTLTGTSSARGYPTFLIIFERLTSVDGVNHIQTRVHFHRCHPCRIKDGVKVPSHRHIEALYQYMAGNIPASDIAGQQGDMIYIKCDGNPIEKGAKVADPVTSTEITFESHRMIATQGTITLYDSQAKEPKNRLGFLYAENGFRVEHPEHENLVDLPGGYYEIRRCKSWEANPKAVWSYSID